MKEKRVEKLPPVTYGTVPGVLLLGNGINRLFDLDSWESIIKNQAEQNGVYYDRELFRSIPYTMQVVAATGDRVDVSMKSMCRRLSSMEMTCEHKEFIREVLELPFSQIITANYTFELERTVKDAKTFTSHYAVGNINSGNNMMLHKFIPVRYGSDDKYIWHIHGQVSSPGSVIMGHYYYGRLLSQIQNYIPSFMRRYKGCCDHRRDYIPESWVDLFLMGDVYVFGFGMDLSEIDMWWLACCKKRNFPESHIYFYEPSECISAEKRMLMQTYGIDIPELHLRDDDYMSFYREAMADISSRCCLTV